MDSNPIDVVQIIHFKSPRIIIIFDGPIPRILEYICISETETTKIDIER